ncbi:Uncharacterized protein FKW44_021144 [Caligus rogercresseyi]|uniref:HTH psq-type domain-containing protein n=1 Tax=Caligus rogercresseyi TaxID=217165 RepID=A0A7T8JV38_CALRO|nr:Uncharacterized protein FKW44_021144 [Caligus rogercresseyi]
METQRHEIAVMIRAHHDTSGIVRILGVDRHTVHRRKIGEIDPEAAYNAFKENPEMTMTEFAEKNSVARTTVSNAV